jgi:hypothetical protein
MTEPPVQPGDIIEILPGTARAPRRHQVRGRPQPAMPYGRVVSVDTAVGQATVYLRERHHTLTLPLQRLRRIEL